MLTFVLKIQNQNLERVKEYKYLGVIFDEKLNWKVHISHLTNRLSKGAGIFYKLRKIVNKNTLFQVYYALVHSHLIYGILPWGRASKSAIRPLCVIVNRIIKAICQSHGRYDAVSPPYQKLQILKIPQLYSMELIKFMFPYQHNLLPANFNSYFEKVKIMHTHGTLMASQSYFSI